MRLKGSVHDIHNHVHMLRRRQSNSPAGEVAVHCACELSTGRIPLVSRLEGDVGGGVVDDSECAHPEVIAKPWHEPELDQAKPTSVVYKRWQHGGYKERAGCYANLDL